VIRKPTSRFASAVAPVMAEKGVPASRIAEHSGMKLSYVRRVLEGSDGPSDDLTASFAEVLGLDERWLRRLRGKDRADATLKAKRMSRGPAVIPLRLAKRRDSEALLKRLAKRRKDEQL
jgi:transcriptional regulator with XRE-family HTH domain